MTNFTIIDTYTNANEIDGTPGCPHVEVGGTIYRCSPDISSLVAGFAHNKAINRLRKSNDVDAGDDNYLQANSSTYPALIALFDKDQPNTHYEFISFMRGLKTKRLSYLVTQFRTLSLSQLGRFLGIKSIPLSHQVTSRFVT